MAQEQAGEVDDGDYGTVAAGVALVLKLQALINGSAADMPQDEQG